MSTTTFSFVAKTLTGQQTHTYFNRDDALLARKIIGQSVEVYETTTVMAQGHSSAPTVGEIHEIGELLADGEL